MKTQSLERPEEQSEQMPMLLSKLVGVSFPELHLMRSLKQYGDVCYKGIVRGKYCRNSNDRGIFTACRNLAGNSDFDGRNIRNFASTRSTED